MANTESEQFSLRWNNFHSNLTAGFHALLEEVDLVDVTLAAGGQFVQAHKIVLSVCSPYFKQLFKVNPCKHPIVILKDVCHKELEAILQFMYQGEVNVRQEELSTFLKTAEMLQIKGLTGHDSPTNNTPTSAPAPMHRPTREKPVHTEPVSLKQDEPHPRPYKRPRTDPPLPVATAPPTPTFAPVAPQPVSPPSVSEDTSGVEFIEMTKPKDEPIEYESDLEELDTKLPVRDDPLVQLLQGETSQSHHDSTQGPPTGMFASIPGLSQDSGGSQDGLQAIRSAFDVSIISKDPLEGNSEGRLQGANLYPSFHQGFKWPLDLTLKLIRVRHQHDHRFTGKRFTAHENWYLIQKELGVEGFVTSKQIEKKWLNLCQRYKEMKALSVKKFTQHMWIVHRAMEEVMKEKSNCLQFVRSRKGKLQLVYENYIYNCEKTLDKKCLWRCVEYNRSGCRSRCHTVGQQLTTIGLPHNHSTQQDTILIKKKFALLLQENSGVGGADDIFTAM